jgi:hypothetical protein
MKASFCLLRFIWSGLFVLAADAVGAVAAAGTAAGAALEMIGRGEDYVFSLIVVVFGRELGRRGWGFVPVHILFSSHLVSIFSRSGGV